MRLPVLPTLATVSTRADPQKAFALTVPVDLPSIFTGWGPLPAVTGTEHQTGAWDAPGQTRTVRLSDGSKAQEALTLCLPSRTFGYTVTPRTGVLSRLAREARGQWWFVPQAGGGTEVWWSYNFHARSVWTWPLLLVVSLLWEAYMRQALRLLAAQLDR